MHLDCSLNVASYFWPLYNESEKQKTNLKEDKNLKISQKMNVFKVEIKENVVAKEIVKLESNQRDWAVTERQSAELTYTRP